MNRLCSTLVCLSVAACTCDVEGRLENDFGSVRMRHAYAGVDEWGADRLWVISRDPGRSCHDPDPTFLEHSALGLSIELATDDCYLYEWERSSIFGGGSGGGLPNARVSCSVEYARSEGRLTGTVEVSGAVEGSLTVDALDCGEGGFHSYD